MPPSTARSPAAPVLAASHSPAPRLPATPSSAALHALAGEMRVGPLASDARSTGASPVLVSGDLVGRYVILGHLGHGGMGVVHAAYDPDLNRKVALKLLLPAGGGGPDGEGRARLVREAQALARLAHPNVVAIHDVGIHDERVWIAMELVAGQTLRAWATESKRSWTEALRVLIGAARGVAAAHAAGLVHRDLKPDNIMIDGDGRVRVMDFGLAHGRMSGIEEHELATTLASSEDGVRTPLLLRLTRAGALNGTPAYMAPEQWQCREAGAAADQFSWCVMAWELLFGERPHAGGTPVELAAAVMSGRRTAPRRGRGVPRWVRRAVERGLAPEPSARWPTMTALLTALTRGQARVRLRMAALVVGGLAVSAAGGLAHVRHDTAQRAIGCEAEGAAIAEIWNDDARHALRSAFLRTGVNYAAATADRVIPWFDERAVAWKAARTTACRRADPRLEGRWDPDTFERASWCLEDRRAAFDTLVKEMSQVDATSMQKAVSAAAGMAPADLCLDEDGLGRQPSPPVEQRGEIQTLRTALARTGSLRLAGKMREGLALATATREAAEGVGWPPILAAARYQEGQMLVTTAAYPRAEEAMEEAYFLAIRAGVWGVAAEAATDLVRVVGEDRARVADARMWSRHAGAALVHAGDAEPLREATRLSNLAIVEKLAGNLEEALRLQTEALMRHEKILGPDHPRIAAMLGRLANVYYDRGEYAKVRELQTRALEIEEATLSPDNPGVATTLGGLANAHLASGEYAEATALHERALAIYTAAYGVEHPHVARSLHNLATVLFTQGEYRRAQELYERSLAIQEKALGREHPDVIPTLNNLAAVHDTLGSFEAARAAYSRGLALKEKAVGPMHPDIAALLFNLGLLHQGRGDFASAAPHYVRALAIREATLGPDHAETANSLDGVAAVHYFNKEYAAAEAAYRRSLAIRERALGARHPLVAHSLSQIADLYLATRRAHAAIELLERSVTIYDRIAGEQAGEGGARFDLARALVLTGKDQQRAIAEARRAQEIHRKEGAGAVKVVAKIEAWLVRHGGKGA